MRMKRSDVFRMAEKKVNRFQVGDTLHVIFFLLRYTYILQYNEAYIFHKYGYKLCTKFGKQVYY